MSEKHQNESRLYVSREKEQTALTPPGPLVVNMEIHDLLHGRSFSDADFVAMEEAISFNHDLEAGIDMPRTETTTVRCDRCRITTVVIEYVPSADFMDEITQKLRALGWRVAGGEICGECVRKEEYNISRGQPND